MSGQPLTDADRADVLRNAIAVAQAGWQAQNAPTAKGRADATQATLDMIATTAGRDRLNLFLCLAQLPGAILAAAGADPVAELAGMAADLDR